ncbi:MAG: NAD(P)H-dependent oxidoreductase [Anaerolineales bacterium]
MNIHPSSPLQVVGLAGSLRPGSLTRFATHIALEGAQEFGAQTELLDLNDFNLPFCDGKKPDALLPEGVRQLRAKIRGSQGIILATPQYHGSFSGVLKNALDWMGFAEFEGKMIGLIGVAGGSTGAMDALNGLRAIGRALHAWVIPEQVSIAESRNQFNPDGSVKDPRLDARLREVGHQVAKYARLHNSEKFMEFLEMYERAPINPGAMRDN